MYVYIAVDGWGRLQRQLLFKLSQVDCSDTFAAASGKRQRIILEVLVCVFCVFYTKRITDFFYPIFVQVKIWTNILCVQIDAGTQTNSASGSAVTNCA